MAQHFRLAVHHSGECLRVTPMGEFDGSSAFELLNSLKQTAAGTQRICVQTDKLTVVHLFGLETFQRNLFRLKGIRDRIDFSGKHRKPFIDRCASRPAPDRVRRVAA